MHSELISDIPIGLGSPPSPARWFSRKEADLGKFKLAKTEEISLGNHTNGIQARCHRRDHSYSATIRCFYDQAKSVELTAFACAFPRLICAMCYAAAMSGVVGVLADTITSSLR